MLSDKETTRISKFLSLVLRHQPDVIGIELDENGWTDVSTLLQHMNNHGMKISPAILEHVVATNNKKRFAFNETHMQIRASQGHTVNIDLGYTPMQPPNVLYHGTATHHVASIMQDGLEKRSRQHVHLSTDRDTAIKVGQRHGQPEVLIIDAQSMYKDGYTFYISDNGVWLTDYVPRQYITSSQH
ncbi:RNA 2'-phosphotransferase [Mucilaginibacter robiniae]|uniref:Probable RNA 2'-phosphotransferase n=1 Tax=Mucilaginibacter robiniae TaxID=2728022 RepID=A0A7L5E431_9SPHI|nr:RNA 2'-phosphotransferase [Mucilaginibacter robiniae]QJD98072.1 RNA 2'-phosphotransferase [Mucilaginibacter robiniae]